MRTASSCLEAARDATLATEDGDTVEVAISEGCWPIQSVNQPGAGARLAWLGLTRQRYSRPFWSRLGGKRTRPCSPCTPTARPRTRSTVKTGSAQDGRNNQVTDPWLQQIVEAATSSGSTAITQAARESPSCRCSSSISAN